MLIKIKKAQSTLEYALLIGVVVGALLAMQNYLKRSIQGRMQIIGDQMGDAYSPGHTDRTENMTVSHATITETTTRGPGGKDFTSVNTNIVGGIQNMAASRNLDPQESEEWPTGTGGQ